MKIEYAKCKCGRSYPLAKYSGRKLVVHDEPTCRPCQNDERIALEDMRRKRR